jgi:hypothetical protein
MPVCVNTILICFCQPINALEVIWSNHSFRSFHFSPKTHVCVPLPSDTLNGNRLDLIQIENIIEDEFPVEMSFVINISTLDHGQLNR